MLPKFSELKNPRKNLSISLGTFGVSKYTCIIHVKVINIAKMTHGYVYLSRLLITPENHYRFVSKFIRNGYE